MHHMRGRASCDPAWGLAARRLQPEASDGAPVSSDASPAAEVAAADDDPSLDSAKNDAANNAAVASATADASKKADKREQTKSKDAKSVKSAQNDKSVEVQKATAASEKQKANEEASLEAQAAPSVTYRAHVQRIGWQDWVSDGGLAGTSAMSLRLEAIEMRLVPKGGGAPGSTENAYIDGNTVSKMGYQNPEGFYQVSSKNVQITDEASAPWNYVTPSRIGVWATREECVNAFVGRAREYLGTPYVWDYSCAPGVGVDCIGLVYQCAYACGMDLGGGTHVTCRGVVSGASSVGVQRLA